VLPPIILKHSEREILMQVRGLMAIAIGISALAATPVYSADKSALAGNTGLSINSSGRLNLVTSVPIDYLNRSVAAGRRVVNLRVGQPLLCADFATAPGAASNPVAFQYLDPNGESSGLLYGGIGSFDYLTNGGAASLLSISADSRLACCVMQPAANANCFQGLVGSSGSVSVFEDGFETPASSVAGGAADLAVSVGGPATVAPGANFNYTITVTNVGGVSVSNVRVRDWFPKASGGFPAALANGTWTCTPSGGASCGVANGAGNLSLNSVSLDPGASVSISASRTMGAAAPTGSQFSVSAAAFAPPVAAETVLGNNQGALSATVQPTSLSINDVIQVEGNSGSSNFQFTITRSNTSSAASVLVSTASGSAQSGTDFTAISNQTVNFTAGGAATAVVNVSVVGDTVVEGNETFTVNLSNPSGASISDAQGVGTISNDDSASVSIADVTVVEGSSGTTNATFTVSLAGAVQGGFSVPVSSNNGSATAPSDYAAIAGGSTVNFTGSVNETRTVTVAVVGDTVVEPTENFQVLLGSPSVAGVSVSDGTGVCTITDDDSASIAIDNVSLSEGNGPGQQTATFTVTLTGAVQNGFTVPVSSADGTATSSGPNADYQAIAGGTTLSFTGAAGQTRTVSVAINGDTIVEADETFSVLLGAPSNAAVSVTDGTGTGTINNNDTATVAIADVSVVEGNSGTTEATFIVTLTGEVQDGFTLQYSSANGTAIAPTDYTAIAGNPTLSFTGSNAETRSITVLVNGDTQVEADETFQVLLGAASVAGVSASDGTAVGTITNDDAATVAINDVSVVEGNSGTVNAIFTVTLSGDVQGGFTVQASSADVSATAPSDYTAVSTTLSFAGTSGETETVTVAVNGDVAVEIDEFFVVNLGAPSSTSVSVSDGTGVGTIQNDDGL
jgi:hypothetical protein